MWLDCPERERHLPCDRQEAAQGWRGIRTRIRGHKAGQHLYFYYYRQAGIYIMKNTMVRGGGVEWPAGEKNKIRS